MLFSLAVKWISMDLGINNAYHTTSILAFIQPYSSMKGLRVNSHTVLTL